MIELPNGMTPERFVQLMDEVLGRDKFIELSLDLWEVEEEEKRFLREAGFRVREMVALKR